ncbi:hypothetical protein THIOSC15_2100002 [uncultured Thiomicrorhabdus sp.]
MFTLTPAAALRIQEEQILWYGPKYPGGTDQLRKHVAHFTNTKGFHPHIPQDIITINRHIPRGGQIENYVNNAKLGFCYTKSTFNYDR